MSDVIKVDDSNFEAEVLTSSLPVLVDLGAPWCAACVRQLPIVEKFATDNLGKYKVVSVDIDDAPSIVSRYSIKSVPTLALFNEGKSLGFKVGLTVLAEINNFVSSKIGS